MSGPYPSGASLRALTCSRYPSCHRAVRLPRSSTSTRTLSTFPKARAVQKAGAHCTARVWSRSASEIGLLEGPIGLPAPATPAQRCKRRAAAQEAALRRLCALALTELSLSCTCAEWFALLNAVRDCGLQPDLVTPDYCMSLSYPPNAVFDKHRHSRYRWGEVRTPELRCDASGRTSELRRRAAVRAGSFHGRSMLHHVSSG